MRVISARGFTLLEIMIVIAIIGVLFSALFPAFSTYIERGRDASRVTDLDSLTKSMNLYYSESEDYPDPDTVTGCVPLGDLYNFGGVGIVDPIPTKNNGCVTPGQYGYGMSTGIIANPDEFALLAVMEQAFGGNYSGSLAGFTGLLTVTAYNNARSGALVGKGFGRNYIRTP